MTGDILKLALRDLHNGGMVVVSLRTTGIGPSFIPAEVLVAHPDILMLILDSAKLQCAPIFDDVRGTVSFELMFARLCGGPRWVTIPFDRIIIVQVFAPAPDGKHDHVGSWLGKGHKVSTEPPPSPTTPVPSRHGMRLVN